MSEQPQPVTVRPVPVQPQINPVTVQPMLVPVQPQVNPVQAVINASPLLAECPPGMQYLIPTSAIIVRQRVELLEVLTGWETANKYDILDVHGLRMYMAMEQADFMTMQCLGASRLFDITILDNSGRPCLLINRTESSMCCNCSGNSVSVMSPGGQYIGQITQIECTNPTFVIQDDTGMERLQIVGPCSCTICGDVSFPVEENGNPIGEIHKEWGGYIMESYTSADTFGVSFPVDLHPKLKCLLLGAVFLIDFMYFERKPDRGGGGGGGFNDDW